MEAVRHTMEVNAMIVRRQRRSGWTHRESECDCESQDSVEAARLTVRVKVMMRIKET
jgi:hypothetical protein